MSEDRFRRFGVFGGFVFFTITGLAGQFFTLYAQELGGSTLAIGVLVTLRAVLPMFIAMPSGQLIDRIGPMKMLIAGNVCMLGSLVLNASASGLVSLVLSQFLLGACIIVTSSCLQVLVSTGDPATRNQNIQRYSMWMSAGGMAGPLLGGLVASAFSVRIEGYRAAFAAAALATLVFMAWNLWLARIYPHPRLEPGERPLRDVLSRDGFVGSYRRGLDLTGHRAVQFGLTATFLIMYVQSLFNGFLPLFMDSVGFPTMIISLALALNGLSAMVTRFALDSLMRCLSPERILTLAGFIAAGCVMLTPLAGRSTVSMLALVMVMGGAVGFNLPVSIMIMADAVGEGERGKLMGLRLLANRVSQMLSPAMFGVLGQMLGLTAAMYGSGGLLLATMFGFSAYASRTRRM